MKPRAPARSGARFTAKMHAKFPKLAVLVDDLEEVCSPS
jgi:hypothetical protein